MLAVVHWINYCKLSLVNKRKKKSKVRLATQDFMQAFWFDESWMPSHTNLV